MINTIYDILKENGITELRPPQKKVIDRGLLNKNKNFLICIPTASGKTVIGEIAFINHLLDKDKTPTGKKGIFIVPLKALASEKYEEFKEKYEKYGLKVALSIGDFDEKEELSGYDLIITTAEKLDSLIRHKIEWINEVSVVIVDEIHLIGDEGRGGTLEVLLTKLKNRYDIQIIGLSATIGNPEEFSEWLNAELIMDDWRPIELKKGIFYDNKIVFIDNYTGKLIDKKIDKVSNNGILNLVVDSVLNGGSCLVFCNSKKGAVNEAKKLNLKKYLPNNYLDENELQNIGEEILEALDQPTEVCKTLAECIKNGVAFHHAGLTYEQRKIVEDAFRKRIIKAICCTPTLCLNANTEILQESGFKKITELNNNEKVFALCGNEIKPVGSWKVHKTPQHEYNIVVKTANGLKITTTPNHIFLVKKGKEYCEKEANNLKTGDYVATIDKMRVEEKDIYLSCVDLYFIGYFIGDGYTGVIEKNVFKGSPDIAFNPEYPPNFDDSELHKKYFLKIRMAENVSHYVYSKKLRKIFNKLNMHTKDNKNIDAFYNLPLEKLSYFIAGLFDSDGYIYYNRKKIEFSSISENLIKKLQLALLRFGIHSTIRIRKEKIMKSPTNGKEYKSRSIYGLIIGDFISVKRFYENIPLKHEEKRRKLEEIVKDKETAKMWCDCGFIIDLSMFKPRTKNQKELNKKRVKLLFELLEGKKLITNYKYYYSKRKNPHFEYIIRENVGGKKKGVYYSLNEKGKILMNILNKNIKDKENLEDMYNFLVNLEKCPICNKPLYKEIRYGWKKGYYDGDIYWDTIKEIKKIKVNDKHAYDIELPDDGTNDHYVVANGFIVHNSAGLNLPCRRAIVKDLVRYSGKGMTPISKMEIHQCIGRAGRPKLDPYGEGIIYAHNSNIDIAKDYLTGSVEEIYSKLSNQKILRTHILGLITTGEIKNKTDLEEFIKNTFYAHQYKNIYKILENINEIVNFLERNNFIECFDNELNSNSKNHCGNKNKINMLVFDSDYSLSIKSKSFSENMSYHTTSLGKRVSELYIDPLSAEIIIDGINNLYKIYNDTISSINILYILYTISKTTEMQPVVRVRKFEEDNLVYEMINLNIDDNISMENLGYFKNAKILYDWINEVPEDVILKKYNIEPGILRYKVEQSKWMVHSAKEIFNLLNIKNEYIKHCLDDLEIRIEYGAKQEIIELLKIRYIGRVRSRMLYNANIKSIEDIVSNPKKVALIVGEKVAKKIFSELNIKYGQQTLI